MMLSRKPPMGWNSWNTFGSAISDSLIRETAEALLDTGLSAVGYHYLVIDDCWSKSQRASDGKLLADDQKFPLGIRSLSDFIHSKGLEFGMYSCAGPRTCAGYPGSFEHEFQDAETFAQWGVDFLKYDYCYKPEHMDGSLLYKRIAMALRSTQREILLSACNWGNDNSETWMRSAGVHMWRSTGDIQDNWQSIKTLALAQIGKDCYGATGCFNDMDMLVVGMYGNGNVGFGGCTDEEYKTHFSLWCLLNSPLMIGCDIRHLSNRALEIMANQEIIAINQDEEGRQPFIAANTDNNRIAWVRPLSNGNYAIGYFNFSDQRTDVILSWWDMGLPYQSGYAVSLHDVWAHEDIGVYKEFYNPVLEPHQCAVYIAKIVKF
jgi:alpha-galactosidase